MSASRYQSCFTPHMPQPYIVSLLLTKQGLEVSRASFLYFVRLERGNEQCVSACYGRRRSVIALAAAFLSLYRHSKDLRSIVEKLLVCSCTCLHTLCHPADGYDHLVGGEVPEAGAARFFPHASFPCHGHLPKDGSRPGHRGPLPLPQCPGQSAALSQQPHPLLFLHPAVPVLRG